MKFNKNELLEVFIIVILVMGLFYIVLGTSSIPPKIKNTNNFQIEISEMLKRHEGVRDKVYQDSEDNPTIGIGFNLNRRDAKREIELLGLDYNDILNGKVSLTDKEVNTLFQKDLLNAIKDAKSFLPDFEEKPNKVKIVLVNMSFNMGLTRLNQFVKFKDALIKKDYKRASKEMKDSRWYHQVGNRSKELVKIMNSI